MTVSFMNEEAADSKHPGDFYNVAHIPAAERSVAQGRRLRAGQALTS